MLRWILIALLFAYVSTEMRMICYFTNWSVYRPTSASILYPDAIDPALCTHIHIAFALIDPQTLEIEPSEKHDTHYTDIFNTPLYLRLYELKQRNPTLKLLVAVGGWTAKSEAFNNILTNSSTRMKFIHQTKDFLYKWHFDGIDLDWEFPGDIERGAMNNSREEYNILIQEMHESFHSDSHPFLLTAAVTAHPAKIDQGYIVPDFCRYLDYISVMTYDYYGAWDNVTGINAPLYARDLSGEEGEEDEQWKNVNNSIHHWLNKGCPAKKLNLGLAAYGRSFTLSNETTSVSIGTESIGGGLAGPYTKENGSLAYFEICQKLRLFNWTSVFDTNAQAPYAYSSSSSSPNNQWVGYDDLKSITVKVLYAKTLNLGGVMIWSLDQDDHSGYFCRQGSFPFTRRIHEIIFSSDNHNEQELISSTRGIKTRSTQRMTFIPIHRHTSQRLISTQSPIKPKNVARSVTDNATVYLFFIVLFFDMTR